MTEKTSLTPQHILAALKKARTELETLKQSKNESIAIIGMACRLPGNIQTLADYWRVLENGEDVISEIPADRWDVPAFYDPVPGTKGRMYSRYGGFIQDIRSFDAEFFGISAHEADFIDPQQRLLLEVTWHAMEHAGFMPSRHSKSQVGVFVGISGSEYGELQGMHHLDNIGPYSITGSTLNAAAGRIAYTFGFQGSCMAIDTACSSSLVAVHQACQSLRNHESDVAIAAGVNLILSPKGAVALSQSNVLASDGRCKTFSADADGMGRSEGCAVLILKRLSDAQQAGDRILAVIQGSAVNQDGASSGLTVPNGLAQAMVIRQALARANVDPSVVHYIEAHGTGTSLGDPIELSALADVFSDSHSEKNPLFVGSVKSNIGHAESASGIASIIKVVLALQQQVLPGNVHFNTPTLAFPWHKHPLKTPTEKKPWPQGSLRVAGVSGFGFSGTNAHIVISDYLQPEGVITIPMPTSQILTVTAKSLSALTQLAISYADALIDLDEIHFGHFCFTANTTRGHFKYRLCFIAENAMSMVEQLRYSTSDVREVVNQSNGPVFALKDMDLCEIQRRYLAGEGLDWPSLYDRNVYRTIDIPQYCFLRQSHWLPHTPVVKQLEPYYQIQWQISSSSRAREENTVQHFGDCAHARDDVWLITDDLDSVKGCKFRVIAMDAIDELSSIAPRKGMIFHFSKPPTEENAVFNCIQQVNILLIWLKRLLSDQQNVFPCVLLTQNAYNVLPLTGKMMNPWMAPLIALFKSVHDESPHLPWGCIDIEDFSQINRALQCWQGELLSAYRENEFYVAKLMRVALTTQRQKVLIRPDAIYLITGGVGALGMQAAKSLIDLGAKQLLLLSRKTELTESVNVWMSQMRVLGCSILQEACDVSDAKALHYLFKRFGKDLPQLAGVIHAAGIAEDALIQQMDLSIIQRVFAAKVNGAWHLHQLTQSLQLDFFVLYSSISTILPSAGQSSYAAANAFMDALATYRQQLGLPGISIQWGPWVSDGMAATAVVKQRMVRSALHGMSEQEGGVRLQQVLNQHLFQQVMIADVDWENVPAHLSNSLLEGLMPKQPVTSTWQSPQPLLQKTQLRERVVMQVHQTLKLPPEQKIDTSQPLMNFGLDSLMVVELRNVLVQDFNIPLATTLFYDYPTIDRLVDYLSSILLETPLIEVEKSISKEPSDAIAIIGLACRFPGNVHNTDDFWQLLKSSKDVVADMHNARWVMNDYYDPNPGAIGKMYTRKAGLLDEIERFDHDFFGISPREASSMDPQQRILLEVCWETLENAGYSHAELLGSRGGVFVGPGNNDYMQLQLAKNDWQAIDVHMGTGNAISAMPGRISYFFGWQGPSMAIDTACSSSLVAVHQACQSLRTGESDHALAAGINLILQPATNIMLSRAGMLSPEGVCKTFDRDANGYVRSEGCGVVMLKRLEDALRDNDQIHGVIRGSAVNQDGRSQGLTAPNGPAQEAVMQQALFNSGYRAADIDYVETHGTGTKLGDPIEVQALYHTYVKDKDRTHPLYLGALKTNIGHTESAAGIAGLIKAVLALKQGMIPANLHLNQLNPLLAVEPCDFVFPTEVMPWPTHQRVRVAAVSSFGFTGTNAHVIVEAPPEPKRDAIPKRMSIPNYPFQRAYCWLESIALGKALHDDIDEIKHMSEEEIEQLMNEMLV